MADEIHHPHDMMVRAVLSDLAEARSFLQTHLPQEVSQALRWSTLTLLESSFVDEDLRASEADFLYEVERVSNEGSIWLYVLLEHQSTPDRWMRFRLLKYCCRIWDQSFREQPDQRELRVIVQLVMLAAYHPALAWMERVARLLGSLYSLPPSGGINYVRIFVGYILATQEPEVAQSFRDVLQRHAPAVGDDLMTYAQELLEKGRLEERVKVIEGFLQVGVEWSVIERATGVNEAQFQALKQQVEAMNE